MKLSRSPAPIRLPPTDATYSFTGIEPFPHDFDNVDLDAAEFDTRLGTPGLSHRAAERAAQYSSSQSLAPF